MNPKQFLLIGGAVLAVVGVVGFLGIIGPAANQSLFGISWYFTNGENWAHLILGVVALLAAYLLGDVWQKWLVVAVGVLGVLATLWGFLVAGSPSPNFYGANLESPADNLLHLVIGLWALWAAFWGKKESVSAVPPTGY